MTGREYYEMTQELAPKFNTELRLWDQLSRREQMAWEEMAHEVVQSDREAIDAYSN